jgi:hypothetical protein
MKSLILWTILPVNFSECNLTSRGLRPDAILAGLNFLAVNKVRHESAEDAAPEVRNVAAPDINDFGFYASVILFRRYFVDFGEIYFDQLSSHLLKNSFIYHIYKVSNSSARYQQYTQHVSDIFKNYKRILGIHT